jgi:hypothetical protein
VGVLVNFLAGINEAVAPDSDIEGVLLNVPQNAASEILVRHSLNLIEKLRPRYTMLDSGGYQVLQKELAGVLVDSDSDKTLLYGPDGINLHPIHVIQAALRVRPDFLVALDRPISKISDRSRQQHEFMEKLGFNIMWTEETAKLRNKYCPEIQLLVPVQAYDLEQFRILERYLADLDYSGLALPTRNLDPLGVSLFLMKFRQMGVRRVHILSYSSFTGIVLASFFARHIFEWVSIDATSWRMNSDKMIYLDPWSLRQWPAKEGTPFNDRVRARCECPWCHHYTAFQIVNTPETDRRYFLRNHNNWAINNLCRQAFQHAGSVASLDRFLRSRMERPVRGYDKLIRALSVVENFGDQDFSIVKGFLTN